MGPVVIAVDKRAANAEIERKIGEKWKLKFEMSEGLLCREGMSTFFRLNQDLCCHSPL